MSQPKNNQPPVLEHPGTWLPGDRVVDENGDECTRNAQGTWDNQHTDAWDDVDVTEMVEDGNARITHLVPREPEPADAPPVLPDVDVVAEVVMKTIDCQVERVECDREFCEATVHNDHHDCITHDDPEGLLFEGPICPTAYAVARDVLEHLKLTPPPAEPEPVPEWTLIPEGRENARVLEVNGVVGTYWRDVERTRYARSLDPDGDVRSVCRLDHVTSVVPVRVLGDDQVAVDRALVERAARFFDDTALTGESAVSVIRDLAALLDGEVTDD